MNIAFRVRRRLPLLAKNYSALSLPRRSESSSVSRRVFSLQVGVVFVFHGESLPKKRLLLIRFLVLRLLLHGESVPAQCQAPTNQLYEMATTPANLSQSKANVTICDARDHTI